MVPSVLELFAFSCSLHMSRVPSISFIVFIWWLRFGLDKLKVLVYSQNGVSVNFLAIYQQLKGIGSCQSVMAVYWGVTGLTDNSRLIEQSLFCICLPDEIYINHNFIPLFWLPCQLCIWNPNLDPGTAALLYYNIFCLLRWNTFCFYVHQPPILWWQWWCLKACGVLDTNINEHCNHFPICLLLVNHPSGSRYNLNGHHLQTF